MSERPAGKGTRTQQHEIVIDAPIEAVWKAISDAEELTRWFVEEANVEPGVGGTIEISWGGDEKGEEPNRRMGAEPEAAENAHAVRDGRGEVRRDDTDGRRVHDRAPRRQDGAAAGQLRHPRRAGVGRLLQRH